MCTIYFQSAKKTVHDKLQPLNEQHENIRFTMDEEEDSRLPFLDVEIKRRNVLMTRACQKKTDTERVLTFSSHPHECEKSRNCVPV